MRRIIIDKAALDAGEPAIQIVHEHGERENCRAACIEVGGPDTGVCRVIQFDKPGSDGTRIEIQVLDGIDIITQ